MIFDINAKVNQFVLLMVRPFSWQVLVSKSVGLVREDRIRYIEVDSFNVPTGRELIGIVKFIGSGDELVNDGSSVYAYCLPVSEPIGSAVLGSSFIVT